MSNGDILLGYPCHGIAYGGGRGEVILLAALCYRIWVKLSAESVAC